jgi:hypothetical protein
MARGKTSISLRNTSANIGFEAKLWLAADKLRRNMDRAEYKLSPHGVTGFGLANDSMSSDQPSEIPSNDSINDVHPTLFPP